MRKIIVLLLLFSLIAAPSYALNIIGKAIYKEVQIGSEKVLVNRITGKVMYRWIYDKYVPIPTTKGDDGVPSAQEMYQTYYEQMKIQESLKNSNNRYD